MARSLLILITVSVSAFAEPRLDQYGDALPDGAIARFGTVRYRIGDYRKTVTTALSSDGKSLAIATATDISVWDVETGRRRLRFEPRCAPHGCDASLCFSPDGKHLVAAGDRDVWVADAKTGNEHFHRRLNDWRKLVAFSPNSTRFAVWNAAGTNAFVFDAAKESYEEFFEPDDRVYALGTSRRFHIGWSNGSAHLIDAETGRVRTRFPDSKTLGTSKSALTPDDQQLCTLGDDGRLHVFDAITGMKIDQVEPPIDWENQFDSARLAISSDGAIAFVWQDGSRIHRYGLTQRKWLAPLPQMPDGKLIFHPNAKRLLLVGSDDILRRYDLDTLKEIRCPGAFDSAPLLATSPDGRRIAVTSGSTKGQIDLFDLNGRRLWSASCGSSARHPRWSADGRFIAHAVEREAVVLDAGTGRICRTFKTPDADRNFTGLVGFSSDGSQLRAVLDNGEAIASYHLASGKFDAVVKTGMRGSADVSPDGRVMSFANGSPCIGLFDLEANRVIVDFMFPPPPLRGCGLGGPVPDRFWNRFSSDGSYAISFVDKGLAILWDSITGEAIQSIQTGIDQPSSFAFSPDGLWIVIGGYDGTVSVWDVASGESLVSWQAHDKAITSAAFAGSGMVLTGAEDTTALLWDMRPKKKLRTPVWEALSGDEALEAYRAIWEIADNANGPDWLRSIIRPATPIAASVIENHITDLGADKFAVREAATKALQSLGRLVEPELQAARLKSMNEEVRTRLTALLAKIPRKRDDFEIVHARAVAAMERSGSIASRKLLNEWAAGAPGARLTVDAKAALSRLNPSR